MTEELKDFNAGDGLASDNGTKAEATTVPVDGTNKIVELAETITNLSTAYEKLKLDSENYKQGMLVSKQKLKDLGIEDEREIDEDKISRMIADTLDAKLAPLMERLKPTDDSIVKKAQRQVEELKLALANRSQISNSNTQSSGEETAVKDNYFTAEQISDLKKRGLDPEKVKATMLKLKANQS